MVLRTLRWAWLVPLLPALALDLSNAGSTSQVWASGLVTAVLAFGVAIAVVIGTLGLGPARRLSAQAADVASVVVTGLVLLSALLPALSKTPSFISLGLLYAIVVLVGVRLAHAANGCDLVLAAMIGVSGVVWPLTIPGDGVVLASLMLTTVVVSAALGLLVREQRRGAERARRAAVKDERREMAHELHDTVAHEITGILILAQATRATNGGPEQNDGRAANALPLIEQASRRALDQVRELVETLRSTEDGGEAHHEPERAPAVTGEPQLRDLVAAFAESTSARVVVDISAVELSTPGWLAIQRVCAEALTNVRRHGGDATEVRVRLSERAAGVELSVANDGTSGHGIGGGTGSGLIGARERVALLGGSFTAGRAEDHWWRVTAWLPTRASIQQEKGSR